jgi:murein L,D-transpeptidase YafK
LAGLRAAQGRVIQRRGFAAGLAVVAGLLARAGGPGTALAALPPGKADKLIVVKGERRLFLVRGGEVVRSYRVALGRQPKGTKIYQGDGRTPEGVYRISAFNPQSRFYRSLRVSYPNEHDRAVARALGQAAGGDIMLHGLAPERRGYGGEHWRFNWTNGCIAVTDREIDEIWQRVEVGTPIEIRP